MYTSDKNQKQRTLKSWYLQANQVRASRKKLERNVITSHRSFKQCKTLQYSQPTCIAPSMFCLGVYAALISRDYGLW